MSLSKEQLKKENNHKIFVLLSSLVQDIVKVKLKSSDEDLLKKDKLNLRLLLDRALNNKLEEKDASLYNKYSNLFDILTKEEQNFLNNKMIPIINNLKLEVLDSDSDDILGLEEYNAIECEKTIRTILVKIYNGEDLEKVERQTISDYFVYREIEINLDSDDLDIQNKSMYGSGHFTDYELELLLENAKSYQKINKD